MTTDEQWLKSAVQMVKNFAKQHKTAYNKKDREISAYFEIGCFHALLNFYENEGYTLSIKNLINGEYRYLTTPSGNPANFSYVSVNAQDNECFEIRQQVRIKSHLDPNIAFTPDIVVVMEDKKISAEKDSDYANGKRPFYSVNSEYVIAAHECKSMVPFPELLVSFVGMLTVAHRWFGSEANNIIIPETYEKGHLAPTLFVGGIAKAMHLKMISALEKTYPINIIVGLHKDTWNLQIKKLNKLKTINKDIDTKKKVVQDDIP